MRKEVPWIIKYRPKTTAEIINQEEAVAKLKNYILRFPKVPKKAVLLYGPPGTGKTSSVYAIANEIGYEVIELNASDVRNARKIKEIVGHAIKEKPFFAKGRIILIDEVDGISGREDKGGLGTLIKLIDETRWPMVLTANDPWDPKLRKLREKCELIEFKKLSVRDIYKALKRIALKERLEIDDRVLMALAQRANGDLRSAINDLETLAREKKKITLQDLEVLGYRDREQTIFQALAIMFKTKDPRVAISAFENVDMDPQEIYPWIEENIPNEYERIDEIYKAYEWLGKGTLYLGRIWRRQHWRFLVYATTFMYAGVALAKRERYHKFTRYRMPEWVRKLTQTKNLREYLKKVAEELKQRLHTSTKRIIQIYLNVLRYLLEKYPKAGERYGKALGLKESQIRHLKEFKI